MARGALAVPGRWSRGGGGAGVGVERGGAGGGNRTRVSCLEGTRSTIELRPHVQSFIVDRGWPMGVGGLSAIYSPEPWNIDRSRSLSSTVAGLPPKQISNIRRTSQPRTDGRLSFVAVCWAIRIEPCSTVHVPSVFVNPYAAP